MGKDLSHIYGWFAGRDRKLSARLFQTAQHLGDPRVHLVFKESLHAEPLPVKCDRLLCLLLAHPVECHEAVQQRRPDKGLQLVQIRLLNSHFM